MKVVSLGTGADGYEQIREEVEQVDIDEAWYRAKQERAEFDRQKNANVKTYRNYSYKDRNMLMK